MNSALQRARATLGGDAPDPSAPGGSGRGPRPTGSALVDGYVDAVLRDDVHAVVALARADAADGGRT